MNRRLTFVLAPVCICVLFAACGGGGSVGSGFTSTGGSGNTAPPPPGLSITTTSLPDGRNGAAYSATLQASGGTAPYKWAISNAPAWLTIDASSGKLSGNIPISNPSWSGAYFSFTVTVSDSATSAHSFLRTFGLNTIGLISVTNAPVNGTRNVPYSWSPYILGGQPPFTITVDSGIPPGLQFGVNASQYSNSFFGTPTEAGTFTAQLHVKDSETPAQDVVIPLTFTFDAKLTITSTALPAAVVGRAFSASLTAVNGTLPLTWQSANLPAGISLDATTGALSGTPTALTGGIGVTLTDSSTPAQSTSSYISWPMFPALKFSLGSNVTLHVNGNLATTFYEYGGMPPVTSSVVSGALPPGLQIVDVYRLLEGTPTQVGTYIATVQLQDGASPPDTLAQSFTFSVLPPLPVLGDLPLPPAALGQPYSAKLWARDGTLPYTWSLAGGQLPPGLSLDAAGNISGTPTALPPYNSSTFGFTAAVTDSASPAQTGQRDYSIAVTSASMGRNDTIANATPASYPGLQASLSPFADPPDSTTSAPDTDYYRLSAKAGTVVDVYVGSSNTVDPAIEIVDANGQRYKTCQDPGDDNPTLTFILKDTTPTAYDDECLNDDMDPTINRSADLKFQVPGSAGTQMTFFVHVFDSSGNARPDMQYNLSLSGEALPPLTISPQRFPGASNGVAYTAGLSGGGGMSPDTWQVASGSLPPGLSLVNDPTRGWLISGTPTTNGNFNFALQITDSETPPQTLSQSYNIAVYDPLLITVDSLPDYHVGQPYSFVLPTSGGVPPFTWGFYAYPWCCLSVNTATGEWTPIAPQVTGTFSAHVSVTDSTGRTTSKTITLNSVQ